MSLVSDLKGDIKAAKKIRIRLPWWAILCAIIGGLLIVSLFDHFGKASLFLPAFNSIAVLGFAIAVKWTLRRQSWFWVTITFLAALQVLLVLFVPWTTKWVPAIAIAAIDSAVLIAMLAIIDVVGRFMEEPKTVDG